MRLVRDAGEIHATDRQSCELRRLIDFPCNGVEVLRHRHSVRLAQKLERMERDGSALLDSSELTFRDSRNVGLSETASLADCGDGSAIFAAVRLANTPRPLTRDRVYRGPDSVQIDVNIRDGPPYVAAVFGQGEIWSLSGGDLFQSWHLVETDFVSPGFA